MPTQFGENKCKTLHPQVSILHTVLFFFARLRV